MTGCNRRRRAGHRLVSACAAAAIAAGLSLGGNWGSYADARPDAGCWIAPPVVLPEPSHTRGLTNTIRWERVPSNCWVNDDAAGLKSKERRFVVTVTNAQTGAKKTVTVRGDDEVDATIETGDFPAGPGGAIDGQRFTYSVVRKESRCVDGSPPINACFDRATHTSNSSADVTSTQDDRAPVGALRLAGGAVHVRTLDVAAAVTASDPGGAAASGAGYVVFSGSPQLRTCLGGCSEPLGGPLTVRLEPGPDGLRTVEARVVDRARRPSDDAGSTALGTPPGNASQPFQASVVLDRTPPHVVLQVSTIRATVGVPVTFDASQTVDLGNGASGVQPGSGRWEFGDGESRGGGLVATHAYRAAGTYAIGFAVTDQVGNRATRAMGQTGEIVVVPEAVPPVPQTTTTPAPAPAPTKVDRTPPGLTSIRFHRTGGRTSMSFRLSERAIVRVQVRRLTPRPARVLKTLSRALRAGRGGIVLPAALRKAGRYEITFVARDAAGNTSRPRTLRLTTRR